MYVFTSVSFLFWIFLISSSDGICYDVKDNTRTHTGNRLSTLTSISACLDYCDQSSTCYAFTWNRRNPSCYIAFANKTTYSVNYAVFFDKIEACSSPSVSNIHVCNGTRAENGIILDGPSFEAECFNVCRRWLECEAANWNTIQKQCYIFNVVPTAWIKDEKYSHATKNSCPVTTDTTSVTSSTEPTTMYYDETTVESVSNQHTSTAVVTTTAPQLSIVGRVIYVQYRHVLNSAPKQTQRLNENSRISCAIQCTKDNNCQGFDFNVNLRWCTLRTVNYEYEKVRTLEF